MRPSASSSSSGGCTRTGKTIIYISHILGDVMRLSDAVAVLRDGNLVAHGPRDEFTIDRMISSMVGRDIENLFPERTSGPTEDLMLEVRNLSKAGISHQIDLKLHKGEVLGVFGLMGSGRSELAQIIFGLDDFDCRRDRLSTASQPSKLTPTKQHQGRHGLRDREPPRGGPDDGGYGRRQSRFGGPARTTPPACLKRGPVRQPGRSCQGDRRRPEHQGQRCLQERGQGPQSAATSRRSCWASGS